MCESSRPRPRLRTVAAVAVVLACYYCYYYYSDSHGRPLLPLLLEHARALSPGLLLDVLLDMTSSTTTTTTTRIFTVQELTRHDSTDTGLYLAVLGKVYDVTQGARHYAQGGPYHGFTGKDASRAFMTGDFTEAGLVDDVSDLSAWELRSIADWQLFYEREYTYLGKVAGRFYDSSGQPTDYLKGLQLKMEAGESVDEGSERLKLLYPPCNVEWSREAGTRVWCTKHSGGVSRDWTGFPRLMYEPDSRESHRCACVKDLEEAASPRDGGQQHHQQWRRFTEYKGCEPKATECRVLHG